MKRASKLAIALLLAALLYSPPVVAQTNQGFEWGFVWDTEFHFDMDIEGDGLLIHEEIYFQPNETLPTIPDSMDNWTDIPWVTMNSYYANGTDMGLEAILFLPAHNLHVPIGNWALLSTLYLDTLGVDNLTIDPENPHFWGYSWADDNWSYGWIHASEGLTLEVHVDYLKADGFLAHYSIESYNTTTREKTGELIAYRLGLEPYTDSTAPALDHPSNVNYFLGQTGNSITWNPSDDYPESYQILLDDTVLVSGDWNSTTEDIVVNVDGHEVGEYNYTIVVADVAGNTASDEVIVKVEAPGLFGNLLLIATLVAAGVVVLIVVFAIRKR
ncbi:MAG: hypothetical protein JSW05_03500 [Candidatus Thorarchaeota archaeon]|nr:MAG: hypothetical protein JSW05_03500 [Candidatus Thorarchaeota archaeon]